MPVRTAHSESFDVDGHEYVFSPLGENRAWFFCNICSALVYAPQSHARWHAGKFDAVEPTPAQVRQALANLVASATVPEYFRHVGTYFETRLREAKILLAEPNTEDKVTQGLPADLVEVMRDPRIIVPRDFECRLADGRTLHEHLEEWRNAPSDTASA